MKTLLLLLPLFFMACTHSDSSNESKEEKKLLNIDALECAYFIKPNKEYPYGEMLTFPNCGKLVNGELQLRKKHLENLDFRKGSESDFGLTTVYANYPDVFYVTKEGKTQRMYLSDMGADHFQDRLARYLNSEDKMGFVNSKLEFVIPAKYDYATSFKNGIAIVSNGSHSEKVSDNPEEEHTHMVGGVWGAIDKKGKIIVEIKYASESEVEKVLKELKTNNFNLYNQHHYVFDISQPFKKETYTKALRWWRASLIKNIGYVDSKINSEVFLQTNIPLMVDEQQVIGDVYQSRKNPKRFYVVSASIIVDYSIKEAGTFGVAGISVHPTPSKKMVVVLAPQKHIPLFGVPLSDGKAGVEAPIFSGGRVDFYWF